MPIYFDYENMTEEQFTEKALSEFKVYLPVSWHLHTLTARLLWEQRDLLEDSFKDALTQKLLHSRFGGVEVSLVLSARRPSFEDVTFPPWQDITKLYTNWPKGVLPLAMAKSRLGHLEHTGQLLEPVDGLGPYTEDWREEAFMESITLECVDAANYALVGRDREGVSRAASGVFSEVFGRSISWLALQHRYKHVNLWELAVQLATATPKP